MNILFLTLVNIKDFNEHGIYHDLLREFGKGGHNVYVASACERRNGLSTSYYSVDHGMILRIRTGNIQKTNIVEKGFSTILLELQFIAAVKKYLSNVHFDLVLYSTPPVTLSRTVAYVKNRDCAKTFLLLKDIFPQNSVDLGILSKHGPKRILYNFFREKEKNLYAISDYIGCTSPANIRFVLGHNPEISKEKMCISCNSVEIADTSCDERERNEIRLKYGLPLDKTIFIYGGNLGKPQDVPFIIKCLRTQETRQDAFFLIVGSGTDYPFLSDYFSEKLLCNMKLMHSLPRREFETLVGACDIGMIFLDYRFTIPNTPSRLLSYLQAHIPVLCCTDPNTDIGDICVNGGFGWKCFSNDSKAFDRTVKKVLTSDIRAMGEKGYQFLVENYSVEKQTREIIEKAKD